MDIDKFLHRKIGTLDYKNSTLLMLKEAFFWEKESSLYPTGNRYSVNSDELPQKMKHYFPSATVQLKHDAWKILYLPNVDVDRKMWGVHLLSFHNDCNHLNHYYRNINNPVAFLLEINNQMPVWREEFKQLCIKYAEAIKNRERKRIIEAFKHGYGEQYYLQDKIVDTLIFTRTHPDAPVSIIGSLKDILTTDIDIFKIQKAANVSVKIDMGNLELHFHREDRGPWSVIGYFRDYKFDFGTKLLTKELLQNINEQLPVWQSEAQQALFDVQKIEKTEKISQNSVRLLVKQRMKEMGCEYSMDLDQQSGNIFLVVKLQKKRMLKVTLPLNMERAKRMLAELESNVQALNNVPMYFRIANQSNDMHWDKEADDKNNT